MSFRKVLLSCRPPGPARAVAVRDRHRRRASPSPSPTASTAVSPGAVGDLEQQRPARRRPQGRHQQREPVAERHGLAQRHRGRHRRRHRDLRDAGTTATVPDGGRRGVRRARLQQASPTPRTHPADVAKENLVTCSVDGSREVHPRPADHPGLGRVELVRGPRHQVERRRHPDVDRPAQLQQRRREGLRRHDPRSSTRQQSGTDANRFAIVLDGLVRPRPGVNGAILNGQAQITGNFTQQTATDLANVLNYGALPLAFDVAAAAGDLRRPSARDQLYAGVLAGAGRAAAGGRVPAGLLPRARPGRAGQPRDRRPADVRVAGPARAHHRLHAEPGRHRRRHRRRSASPPTRSSCSSNASGTRCATAAACGSPSSRAGAGPGAPSWPPTPCRSSPRSRCTCWRSATCRASRSRWA